MSKENPSALIFSCKNTKVIPEPKNFLQNENRWTNENFIILVKSNIENKPQMGIDC